MRNKHLKEINQRLDRIEGILVDIRYYIKHPEGIKREARTLEQKAIDDYYYDPTKYPNIESDIHISETNNHFR